METKQILVAALAAWFSVVAGPAQAPPAVVSVDARMAASVLAESRGDVDAAIRELELARAAASPEQRARLDAALTTLRQRVARPAGAVARTLVKQSNSDAQHPNAQDPVLQLIARLDLGTDASSNVGEAMQELRGLGVLALPQLLAAFPKLGPFGVRNALQLLVAYDDPRVRDVLRAEIERTDVDMTGTLAWLLDDMAPGNRALVATHVAKAIADPERRLAAFQVLVQLDSEAQQLTALVHELLATSALHEKLFHAAQKSSSPWTEVVFAELADHGTGIVRALATEVQLLRQEDLTEQAALAAIQNIEPAFRWRAAAAVLPRHPAWVKVALLALDPNVQNIWLQVWVGKVEWWRQPGLAVPALLSLPNEAFAAPGVKSIMGEIVRSDWSMPLSLEPAFVRYAQQGDWRTFVAALPEDAEARAIAIWQGLGFRDRYQLVSEVVQRSKSWHRLLVMHLADLDLGNAGALQPSWLQRSWSGMDEDTARRLAEVVAKWQQHWPVEQPNQGATATAFLNSNWRQSLISTYRKSPDLPNEVLVPLLRAQDVEAWSALAQRDPLAALAEAGKWSDVDRIAAPVGLLLLIHGEQEHLTLAIKVQRALHQGQVVKLEPYFQRFGAGQLQVIALAQTDLLPLDSVDAGTLVNIAKQAALHAKATDLTNLLALAPTLEWSCVANIFAVLSEQLRPEHASTILAAMPAAVDAARKSEGRYDHSAALCREMLGMLVKLNVLEGAKYARALLGKSDTDVHATLLVAAAKACIALAGEQSVQVVGELLKDDRPAVVTVALASPQLRGNAELRQQAKLAMLRLGSEFSSDLGTFAVLEPDDATALATAVLMDARLPQFSTDLCNSALQALGDRKDGALAKTIARGMHHQNISVRETVTEQLGRTYSQQAAPFLLEMLKDDDGEVREKAKKSLAAIAEYLDAQRNWQERLK